VGERMSLKYTRAIVDAIHSGALREAPTVVDETFGLEIPTECPGVPSEILQPKNTWKDGAEYDKTAAKLSALFRQNFRQYEEGATPEVAAAGPK
jgi:phosphoenolpyruvate carboxykinase (ATP)